MAFLPFGILSDRSGNFGIMTALIIVPLLGAGGLAIDFGRALTLRTELYAAADAAAVGAVSEKSAAVTQAMSMSSDGVITLGSSDARDIFFAQQSGNLQQIPVNLNISVTKTGAALNSSVAFSAAMPTTFMQIFGQDTVTIAGTATAQYQTPSFMDFFMLLDNTPSMGVGATPTDVQKMRDATVNGRNGGDKNCAFACHIVSESGVDDPGSYYNLARSIGATIRIDVVAQATAALMTTAINSQAVANQFRMAAYTFGKTAQDTSLFTVSKLTADLTSVSKATDTIKLMSIPYQNYNNDQQTSFDSALTSIGKEIDTPGAGTSNTDRQKIVFFVGDGVGDSEKSKGCTKPLDGATRCMEPIDTSFCQKLKDRNIKIAVLYTTYLPLPENPFYMQWISPFQSQISTKMKECASPGFYFEVSPTEGIQDAMNALFLKIVSAPRITS